LIDEMEEELRLGRRTSEATGACLVRQRFDVSGPFAREAIRASYSDCRATDDLVSHVLEQEPWEVLRFPAIAEADEVHEIMTILGPRSFRRGQGGALHPKREPLDTLDRIRRTIGEYNFAGQ
jgi:hypothetical protein